MWVLKGRGANEEASRKKVADTAEPQTPLVCNLRLCSPWPDTLKIREWKVEEAGGWQAHSMKRLHPHFCRLGESGRRGPEHSATTAGLHVARKERLLLPHLFGPWSHQGKPLGSDILSVGGAMSGNCPAVALEEAEPP